MSTKKNVIHVFAWLFGMWKVNRKRLAHFDCHLTGDYFVIVAPVPLFAPERRVETMRARGSPVGTILR